jgi:hypothetical protein
MPVALPIIAVALTAVGTGVAAYGAVSAGNKAEEAGKRTQEAENANAKAAQDQAALEAAQVRRKNLLRLGEQRATAAKSGVLINDSAADVIYDTSIQGELEAQSALYGGATASSYYRSRGGIAALEGKNAKSASRISAAGTVIGGLGSAAKSYPSMSSSTGYNRSNYGPS